MAKRNITNAELFGVQREIIILHAGEEYRLRITGNNRADHDQVIPPYVLMRRNFFTPGKQQHEKEKSV